MEKNINIIGPKYQQIAIDLASKIVSGHHKVGDKVYARSSIASQYGVSSETARRAICVLVDLNIVESNKGSGVLIKSYDNAVKFIKQYEDIRTVSSIKDDMLKSVERQKGEMEFLSKCMKELIDKTERFNYINPFIPFQIVIDKGTPYLNKSLSEINFWHNTSATVIAIKRAEHLMMSPGPYATLNEEDILFFVGNENSLECVKKFLYP